MPIRNRHTGWYLSSLIGGPARSVLLVRACRRSGVRCIENVLVTDLLIDENRCCGEFGFHKQSDRLYGLQSGAVILATCGAGAAHLQNDNAPGSTGDGYRLAIEGWNSWIWSSCNFGFDRG